jgi:uncharacterized protein YfaS (alpha-2-macroglobulin family)
VVGLVRPRGTARRPRRRLRRGSPGGVYTYTYVARATTPGVFVAPPPRAEEMYEPETFGRGASDRVAVER